MKWVIFLAISIISCSGSESKTDLFKELKDFVNKNERVSPIGTKPLRWKPKGVDGRWFYVDRNKPESVRKFVELSGKTYGRLFLKNFDTNEKVSDLLHRRMVRGLRLEFRKTLFDFTDTVDLRGFPPPPRLVLMNNVDGWFPFGEIPMPVDLKSSVIRIKDVVIDCDSYSKYTPLVDRYGSLLVHLEHDCDWRYWNFDGTKVSNFSLYERNDLHFNSSSRVVYLKVKGFEGNVERLKSELVDPLQLDRIREVGVSDYKYKKGCVRFERTDPSAVFLFKRLDLLRFDVENFQRSAPFVIDSAGRECLNLTQKIELFERFGIVALRIIDNCVDRRRVLILNGRQPFEYVKNREDVKFHDGDVVLYSRIRDFTSEHHLRNLETWFHEMGYSDVKEIGDPDEVPKNPEVSVTGSIAAFFPFPFLEKVNRKGPARHMPAFYFRNNSGVDCRNRRSFRTLKHVLGSGSVATSRDCECGAWTSSEFFWKRCTVYRGILEITGSTSRKELQRYKKIRKIRDGQVWIHDTAKIRDLSFLAELEEIECRKNTTGRRTASAVRIDGHNDALEEVEFPKLKKTTNCKEVVWMGGNQGALPEYAESKWMEKKRDLNDVTVIKQEQNCNAHFKRGIGRHAEFAHHIDQCPRIHGDLIVDGSVDDVARLTHILRNVRRISGNVLIRNLKVHQCQLLQHVRIIDGNLTFESNPFLTQLALGLVAVRGEIRFSRAPKMCWELERMRPFVEAFKGRSLLTDCPSENAEIFDAFEDRYGDIDRLSHIVICYSLGFTVCYMMCNVFGNYAESMNVTKWRVWTELDGRLRSDPTAYLDEESSEEEMDVMTLERKERMKKRLDGRDVVGDNLRAEQHNYRENRRGPGWKDKLKAVLRSRVERLESDSDFSGHSWLPEKQAKQAALKKKHRLREKKMREIERRRIAEEDQNGWYNTINQAESLGLDREWAVSVQKMDAQEQEAMESEYFAKLNEIMKNVMKEAHSNEEEYLTMIWKRLKECGMVKENEAVMDLKRMAEMVEELQRRNLAIKKENWKQTLKDIRAYRKEALAKDITRKKSENALLQRARKGEKKRKDLEAARQLKKAPLVPMETMEKPKKKKKRDKSEKKEKKDPMFMPIKVESTNFGPDDVELDAVRTTQYEQTISQRMPLGPQEEAQNEPSGATSRRDDALVTAEHLQTDADMTLRVSNTQETELDASTKAPNLAMRTTEQK